MPAVTVLYFAGLREARGRADEVVSIAPDATVEALFRELFPGWTAPVTFMRNRARVAGDARIEAGDEVAFLPPLGGG